MPDGGYCWCLEKKLPQMNTHTDVTLRYVDPALMDKMYSEAQSYLNVLINQEQLTESREEMTAKLTSYGLGQHEIEMLIARFFDDQTFQEMVSEQGWTSTGSAAYHYKKTLEKLRKKGFKL